MKPFHLAPRASVAPTLVGGLLGDPLLHIRLPRVGRSILFDLGAHDLSPRVAHQVTDACVTHAHLDHFAGFGWLLRSRMGVAKPCRVYGPPQLAHRVQAAVDAFTWNLVEDRGPRFQVTELDGDTLRSFLVTAGRSGPSVGSEHKTVRGLLWSEPSHVLRAVTLDHGIPVLAISYEETRHVSVRKERLEAACLPPGPWLAELKSRVLENRLDEPLRIPTGQLVLVRRLASDFLVEKPGQRIVYATDLADRAANRAALVGLARGADMLICEATFLHADRHVAGASYHLTARACAEIAAEAQVGLLVPFHFSRRYERRPEAIFSEVLSVFPRVLVPPAIRERLKVVMAEEDHASQ
ncbi:MAG: MBL fold metallo-hydrolase [Deltaproteobacteria bacterium]|nr:MBL fold metallo-hydrolase [Deltaproteobacteria bacterium]